MTVIVEVKEDLTKKTAEELMAMLTPAQLEAIIASQANVQTSKE